MQDQQSMMGMAQQSGAQPVGQENTQDVIDRLHAAGVKVMYSPGQDAQRQKAIQDAKASGKIANVIALNVTGLMLILDKQTKGGVPAKALFPAAMQLAGDAEEMLGNAGIEATPDDMKDVSRQLYVMLAKKFFGATDEQINQGASNALKSSGQGSEPAEPMDGEPETPEENAAEGGQEEPGEQPAGIMDQLRKQQQG